MIAWEINQTLPQPPCASISTAFSVEECDRVKKLGESLDVTDAHVGYVQTTDNAIRATKVSWIKPEGGEASWLFNRITDLIHHANRSWFRYDLIGPENFQYTIYDVGSFYSEHTDTLQVDNSCRKLSFTLQLSDPEEYQGGDVKIYHGNEPIVFDKQIGSIYFFPSYMLHEVKPVTKGTRKALVGWVHGPQWR